MEATPPARGAGGRRSRRLGAASLVAALAATSATVVLTSSPVDAGSLPVKTRLVSRTNAGGTSPGLSSAAEMSGNGRFVAFVTSAVMSPADTNGKKDIYVRDLWAGTTELVSLTDDDKAVLGDSIAPSISDDGRFVLFLTKAANLIPGDDKGYTDAFLRDRFEGTTRWISVGLSNTLLNNQVVNASLSGDGTISAFSTSANNVVPNDTNGDIDVFVRENFGSTIDRVSVSSLESQAAGNSDNGVLSNDGRYVVFYSDALLAGGVNGETNVYLRDRTNGTTELVNVKSDESLPDKGAGGQAISGDGRYVAFASAATNLVAGDTNGVRDVFLRDRTAGTTVRVSLTNGDAQLATGAGTTGISDAGPTVLFFTNDQATAATDADGEYDVYARNVANGTTRRISYGPSLPDPANFTTSASMDDSGKLTAFFHPLKLTGESFDQTYVNGPVDLGPFLDASDAISPQYHDFLGRSPTASETSTWSARFDSGQAQLPTLIAALAADPAFSASRSPLIRLYWAFFLRRPDSSGLTYWLGKYQSGSSLTKIAGSFAGSSEFKNRYGNVSNQQYVKQVYVNVFGRQPDASGLAYWTKKLDTKALTRGAVIVQFSESSEGKRRLAGPTGITLVSLGMLRTTPTAAQWDLVYEQVSLGEPQPLAFVAHELMGTAQYKARYQ